VLLPIRDRTRTADGLAFASFRVPDLVRNAIGAEERDADLAVYDAGRERTLTYSTRSTPARDAHVVHFKMMGRPWELAYAPIHRFTEDDGLLAYLPIAGGALLALLAMGLLRMTERTERRAVALAERMTEELRDSREELARSNAELERFAYVASHDLREPLRTVNGFVGLLSRRYRDRLDEDGKEFIDHAVQGVHRMDGLIAELLQYSRAGRREAGAEPTDLNAAWSVAVRNLSAAISEAGAHVTASPLPTVLAERGEMVQLFQNLLGNAIKYRAHDGPRIHVTAVPREDGTWEVSVIDDGPGIAPKDHERIFVLLERLHTYDDIEGSGIGLSLCRRIVERHGGSIWVESDLGAGARFAFALPGAPAADGDDPPEAVSPVVRDAALRAPSEPLTAAVAHAERARREHARRVRES
jgi:signal transduction histidine kinase